MAREMKITDSALFHDFDQNIEGKDVVVTLKRYEDLKGIFECEDESIAADTVMYEIRKAAASDKQAGRLNWAVSLVHPVSVNGECNMTRGHFHKDEDCEEYYWCAAGRGLLMLMDDQGNCWCEKLKKGSLHHIDGHLAHRLINTGSQDLKVICVWNANAGHDYERIEKYPFPFRVFRKNRKIVVKER